MSSPARPPATFSAAVAPLRNLLAHKHRNIPPEALETLACAHSPFNRCGIGLVLASATNPQEVLDAGNWLVAHPDPKGKS